MAKIKLKYGKSYFDLKLAKSNKIKIVKPRKISPISDFKKGIYNSINNPIGTKPLIKLLEGKKSVAIVIPDSTRICFSNRYLPCLINEIKKAGIEEKSISIIIANGAHKVRGVKVASEIVGKNVFSRIKVIDHNCDDEKNLVYVGETSRHTKVYLNKRFMQADFKILTGIIGFHYFAGYGGGRKSVVPGIASRATIEDNHKLFLNPEGGLNRQVEIGKLKGNPVHEDMLEAAKMSGVDFITNLVFDDDSKLIGVFSGDLKKAHEAGTRFVKKLFFRKMKGRADVVIVSCSGYPNDVNFIQAHKAMQNASYALKKGGKMICLAQCSGGVGSSTILGWFKCKSIKELEAKLKKSYMINGHTALSLLVKASKFEIIFVSLLPANTVKKMKMIPARSLNEALKMIELKPSHKVLVIPKGSTTLAMP